MTIPKGITLVFYVRDTESLPYVVGQKVDKILAGRAPPAPAVRPATMAMSSPIRHAPPAGSALANLAAKAGKLP